MGCSPSKPKVSEQTLPNETNIKNHESPSKAVIQNENSKKPIQAEPVADIDDKEIVQAYAKAPNSFPFKLKRSRTICVPRVNWSEISIPPNELESAIIGEGAFGRVLKVHWKPSLVEAEDNIVVVVKVMTEYPEEKGRAKACAIDEAGIIIDTESRIFYKECIVRVYGIAQGFLPKEICEQFSYREDHEAVGIIMRYEGRGTLTAYMASKDPAVKSIQEKLRLLTSIAQGLAELHAAGITHGDIKPDNILLSLHVPPRVRLADFGFSHLREDSLLASSLAATASLRGTPIYAAPEMLTNALENTPIARPSRKTDLYAFAILAWEVLSGLDAFSDVRSQAMLSIKVHKGVRPPPEKLPSDCPHKVSQMLTACWAKDRHVRKSSVECFSILQHCYYNLTSTEYDLMIVNDASNRHIAEYVFHRLNQLGFTIHFSDPEPEVDDDSKKHAATILGRRCKFIVVCMCQAFQNNPTCKKILKDARSLSPPLPVIPIFVEANHTTWLSEEHELVFAPEKPLDLSGLSSTFAGAIEQNDEKEEEFRASIVMNVNPRIDELAEYLRSELK